MTSGDFDDEVEIWPDVWPAFCVLDAMSTQWRVGMGGAVGLDYAALPVVFKLHQVRKKDRPSVFSDLRVMEAEALACMAESKPE
ncbi:MULTISPECIES: DUF1799 domain-containing protein [unclassified Pseudomonas]|uniref:DUF1799 domain-containing protein n=1 Tax=Pseudomonas sp. URIL14HWK12:I9 TaxID=1261633 RepID=UPI00211409C4|nr:MULTISPECIES: DUF1799 domain-containing protein [unclassified Pseudomonas]